MRLMRSVDPVITYSLLKDRLVRLVMDVIDERCAEAEVPEADRHLAADLYAGGLVEVTITWLEGSCAIAPEELVARVENVMYGSVPAALASRSPACGRDGA